MTIHFYVLLQRCRDLVRGSISTSYTVLHQEQPPSSKPAESFIKSITPDLWKPNNDRVYNLNKISSPRLLMLLSFYIDSPLLRSRLPDLAVLTTLLLVIGFTHQDTGNC